MGVCGAWAPAWSFAYIHTIDDLLDGALVLTVQDDIMRNHDQPPLLLAVQDDTMRNHIINHNS